MTKKDRLDLAIAKCFGQSRLTEEDVDAIKGSSQLKLVDKHGLSETQARNVMLWCQNECQRMWGQETVTPHEDPSTSPFHMHKHRGFRS